MKWGGTFEQTTTQEFEPLPKGRYACTLDNATIEETKTNKTPYLDLACTIADGDKAGRKLWVKLWMTEGAYNMTSQQLANLMVFDSIGQQPDQASFMNRAADLVFQLVGKKIEVSVTGHDEYNEKKYEKTFVTGFLDMPNSAIQQTPKAGSAATAGGGSTVNEAESLPF